MGGGDEAGAEPSGGFFEEAVSRRAGGGFDAVARRQLPDAPRGPLRRPRPAGRTNRRRIARLHRRRAASDGSGGRRKGGLRPPVFRAAIARNSATLSPPPETATSTVTSAQSDGGQASANLVSSGWSMGGVGSGQCGSVSRWMLEQAVVAAGYSPHCIGKQWHTDGQSSHGEKAATLTMPLDASKATTPRGCCRGSLSGLTPIPRRRQANAFHANQFLDRIATTIGRRAVI